MPTVEESGRHLGQKTSLWNAIWKTALRLKNGLLMDAEVIQTAANCVICVVTAVASPSASLAGRQLAHFLQLRADFGQSVQQAASCRGGATACRMTTRLPVGWLSNRHVLQIDDNAVGVNNLRFEGVQRLSRNSSHASRIRGLGFTRSGYHHQRIPRPSTAHVHPSRNAPTRENRGFKSRQRVVTAQRRLLISAVCLVLPRAQAISHRGFCKAR